MHKRYKVLLAMEAKGLGANAFIRKPFHHEVLLKTVQKLLPK